MVRIQGNPFSLATRSVWAEVDGKTDSRYLAHFVGYIAESLDF